MLAYWFELSCKRGNLTKIIRVLPSEAHLQIVILDNQIHEPLQQVVALLLGDSVYFLDVRSHGEYTLPTRDWVSAYNRVLGAKLFSNVLGSAAWARVNFEVVVLSNLIEARLSVCCSKTFQEFLVRL